MPSFCPPPPLGPKLAAAERSAAARFVQPPNAFGWLLRNVVWKAGIAYSLLQPLVVAPTVLFHTVSVKLEPLGARFVPPTASTSGAEAGYAEAPVLLPEVVAVVPRRDEDEVPWRRVPGLVALPLGAAVAVARD